MNILIPHTWLLEHLETTATPEEIQRLLSLSGPSVERIYEREGEPVYDVEVTTNRVDSMSVRGIAREAAVILQQAGIHATLKDANLQDIAKAEQTLPLPTITNDPKLCKRILCVVLSNIQHTPTPDWMAKRLTQIEQNVHDAVIDITNYITHELGHPCHAFDYDKIMALGGVIKVVEAQPGKTFTTLDGAEYTTIGGEVVFENEQGEIIDLPAIKGTMNTAVDDHTKHLLFWIESINAKKVRHGSMSHAIRTVAAQLNEKNVDPHLADSVLQRGVQLYQELCHAQVASKVYDLFPKPPSIKPISVDTFTIENYLGINLKKHVITEILENLGCTLRWQEDTNVKVTPPTFRPDIQIPADVVEELARMYGYHNLPSTLMATTIPLSKPQDAYFDKEHRIKELLADLGWQEVYTYSMVSEQLAEQSGFALTDHLKLQNPLTDDRVYLRRSLVPSLQEVLNNNTEHATLQVFEIAKVYHPIPHDLPNDELYLTMVSQLPYRHTRGVLETLLRKFYVLELEVIPDSASNATILVQGKAIGTISPLAGNRFAVDLRLKELLPLLKSHPKYEPLPKTAAIIEDLTFVLPEHTLVGDVMSAIQHSHPLVKKVELHDVYQRNFSFTITYHDTEKNLSSLDIAPVRKEIVDRIMQQFSATLIGTL